MSWNQQQQRGYGGVTHNTGAFQMEQPSAYELTTEHRMAFIRRVYSWLLSALGVFAVVATISATLFVQNWQAIATVFSPFIWLAILAGSFIITAFVVSKMLMNPKTAAGGLFLYAAMEGVIFGPLLAIAYFVGVDATTSDPTTVAASSETFVAGGMSLIIQAVLLTGLVFGGLSAYVFLTKQDFSWMRGMLMVGGLVFMGVILIAIFGSAFGMAAGGWLSYGIAGFGVLLASGFILYDTSNILHHYSGAEGEEKMAAFQLLADVCLLLWYILYFLIQLNASE